MKRIYVWLVPTRIAPTRDDTYRIHAEVAWMMVARLQEIADELRKPIAWRS